MQPKRSSKDEKVNNIDPSECFIYITCNRNKTYVRLEMERHVILTSSRVLNYHKYLLNTLFENEENIDISFSET